MGKRLGIPVAVAIAIGIGLATLRGGNPCGTLGGTGPCDAGYPSPAVNGFGLGSFGWGPECNGWNPAPGVPGYDNTSVARYVHTGNITYDGGMYLDTSLSCCKSNGDCVEMWGDDPISGNNIGEAVTMKLYSGGDFYGMATEAAVVTNRLHDTRDVCTGWTSTGPTCVSNANKGPFGYFLGGPTGNAMARVTVVADGGPQQLSQSVDSGSNAGPYACSCWLKAETIGTARIAITGTGSSGADRTCTVVMSDAGTGRREGCITSGTGYASGLTGLTCAVIAGAADNVSGTFGMSDCQLERDSVWSGGISMYISNLQPAGFTATRNNSVYNLRHPDSGVSDVNGCVAAGHGSRVYDSSQPSVQGVFLSSGGGVNQMLFSWLGNDLLQSSDQTNTLQSYMPGLASEGDGGFWWAEVEWDGGQMCQYDGGSNTAKCGSKTSPLWRDGDDLYIGSEHGTTTNSWHDQIGPISWGQSNECRSPPRLVNKNGHKLYIVGDGFSGGGTNNEDWAYPKWSDYVQGVVTADPHAVGVTNRWLWNGQQGSGFPDRKIKFGSGTFDSEAVWMGSEDFANDGGLNPDSLFAFSQYYMTREARKGIAVYWFDVPPSEGAWTSRVQTYNRHFRDYCADGGFPGYSGPSRPEPNLRCVDVNLLLDPDQDDHTTPAYLNASGFLTDAGARAVGSFFLQNWP